MVDRLSTGKKIKLLRILLNANQFDFASRIRLTQPKLCLVENDQASNNLTNQAIDGLDKAFGVSLDDPRFEEFANIVREPVAA